MEDNENQRKAIISLLQNDYIKIKEAASGKEAIKALKSNKYDCIILDISLPDINGFDLLTKLEQDNSIIIPPVIIYTGKELSKSEEQQLNKYSNSIIIKGVKSKERLLDETTLFLHQIVDNMPEKKRKIIYNLYDQDKIFLNKKILLVDDDMRNVYALSNILRKKGLKVFEAVNGQNALDILKTKQDINIVIMDIMMPIMDGYEAIKKIREQKRFCKLPIFVLTAKAMQQDQEKCLKAGATEYLSKPLDINRLFSMLRVWLYK